MSFPNPRRGSLGSLGAGDLSFPNSRRNSLAFGLDFDMVDQQQQLQQQLPTDSISALPSHSHTMASRSLLNASLAGQSANAQLLLGSTSGREGISLQQRQMLLQQQLQQRQSLPGSEPSSDASRVQAEAQAAAAALFLGAPLPSSDNSPTSGLGLSGLGHLGQAGSSSGQGSRNLLGNPLGLPSPLAASSNFPTSAQDLNLSMQQLRSGAANNSGSSFLPSLDTSHLSPLSSFSQLQQRQQQQQQQLQLLQSSLGGGQNRLQQSSQQLQDQDMLQQLQLQQQLQRQQQQIRRHSLSMDFPFDTSASGQQLEQPQSGLGLSMSEQLRQHQAQLDKLQSRNALFSSGGKKTSSRAKAGSKGIDEIGNSASKGNAKKDTSFPLKLHEILSNPEYEDMISWMPHGKSWRILKPSVFENVVIPLHFRHSKYASFMRQVNGWGFQRVLHGNDHNSYKHDLFVKDKPELCKKMKRVGTVKKIKDEQNAADDSAQADAADQLGVNSLSAARSALSSKFASSVGALGIPNSELQMLQDASALGNLGLGQFEGRSSMEQMLKFTPSLNQQQLQQQLAASEQGLSSLQRHLDISKLMGGGGGASGLLGQSGSLLSTSAVSAQRQAALASRLRANQQQADDQTKNSRNAEM